MNMKKLEKHLKEHATGSQNAESIQHLALRLHKEGYAPTNITKALKKKFGKGVPLTIFGKGAGAGKTVKSKLSAHAAIHARIADRVLLKANETVTTIYETGEAIEGAISPTARLFGYDNTAHFVIHRLLPFFLENCQRVETLETENTAIKEGLQLLMKDLSPYAKKALFHRDASDLIKLGLQAQAIGGHPISAETMEQCMQLMWEIDYADPDEALRRPTYWVEQYMRRVTGRR